MGGGGPQGEPQLGPLIPQLGPFQSGLPQVVAPGEGRELPVEPPGAGRELCADREKLIRIAAISRVMCLMLMELFTFSTNLNGRC